MSRQPTPPADTADPAGRKRRRGVILVAVLVALVVLSLAAYQYSDLMVSEYRAADNAHRAAQARLFAESGIHYAAALLAAPTDPTQGQANVYWNNSGLFMDVQVPSDDKLGLPGRFSIIAPPDSTDLSGSSGWRYGVGDEGAKINLNVLMQLDPSGNRLYNALMLLPNMTSDIANSIVDWLDADGTPRDGGAEDDYYSSLSPPYHCKNGPLESLEELLLVKGVTPQLLFGNDLNHNGVIDPEEDNSGGPNALGWAAFLTVYSREQNSDSQGNPYLYLNDTDLSTLYTNLSSQVDDGLAKFIILFRQYGVATTGQGPQGNSQNNPSGQSGQSGQPGQSNMAAMPAATTGRTVTTGGATPTTTGGSKVVTPTTGSQQATMGDITSVSLDFTKNGKTKISSLFALVNASVTVPGSGPGAKSVMYSSPLSDPGQQATLLPKLFSLTTMSQGNEIPARININTAPQEVLTTIQEFQDSDIQTILSTRPKLSSSEPPDPIYQTPAWLLTQAQLNLAMLQQVEKYVTTRTQVYRVQSVGYFDDRGPSARVEAIIDTNGGRPRILMFRDLTALGKGWTKPGQ